MLGLGCVLEAVAPLSRPVPGAEPQTYVLLAFGQSNMVDQSSDDQTVDWPANVQILNTESETLEAPVSPLTWLESRPGETGNWETGPGQLVKAFCRAWSQDHPEDQLIVVPAARGGTGFIEENWMANGQGRLYNEAVRLLDGLFTTQPAAQFLAVLAQHGERDGKQDNHMYLWNAQQFILKLRARYNRPDLPVIWGEPGPVAQFSVINEPGYEVIRQQIRQLPDSLAYVATARAADPAIYDGLNSLDGLHFERASQQALGNLHHRALAHAQTNSSLVASADVKHIWLSSDEQGYLSFEAVGADVQAGDQLVLLACAHRGSGTPTVGAAQFNGDTATLHLSELIVQNRRLGLSVASVTLTADPVDDLIPVALDWGTTPASAVISIWRIRGAAPGVDADNVRFAANLGGLSVDLSAGLPGTVLSLAYGAHTGGSVQFSGDATSLLSGPSNGSSTYFQLGETLHDGSAQTLSFTPSEVPDRVCGAIAVMIR